MSDYRVNVYENEEGYGEVVARVRYNADLDYWDGRNYSCGSTGRHMGITKLKDGRFVLINGTDWQGESDSAYIVSKKEALQEILRCGKSELLDKVKYKELKELYESSMIAEEEDEEEKESEEKAE